MNPQENLVHTNWEQLYGQEAAQRKEVELILDETTEELVRISQALDEKNKMLDVAMAEIKILEQHLVQNDKMVTLGQLVAGVAHEINTPLGAINAASGNLGKSLPTLLHNYPEMMKTLSATQQELFFQLIERSLGFTQQLTSREERQYKKVVTDFLEQQEVPNAFGIAGVLVKIGLFDELDTFLPLFKHDNSYQIIEIASTIGKMRLNIDNTNLALAKMQKIVGALKNYSHRQADDSAIHLNLVENIDMVLTIYHNSLKYGIEVVKNYPSDLPLIMGYPDELSQVWTNIVHNSIQAMNGKGRLEITIASYDNGLKVSINDNGPGIPADIMPRIFEAFFTTKPAGEGTGLGLDIVRRIIEKHKGKINVESEPDNTTFYVWLPITL